MAFQGHALSSLPPPSKCILLFIYFIYFAAAPIIKCKKEPKRGKKYGKLCLCPWGSIGLYCPFLSLFPRKSFMPNSNFTYFRKKRRGGKFVLLSVRDFRCWRESKLGGRKIKAKSAGKFRRVRTPDSGLRILWVGGRMSLCGCVFAQFGGRRKAKGGGGGGQKLSLIRWHVCKMARCVSGIHFHACQKDGRKQDDTTKSELLTTTPPPAGPLGCISCYTLLVVIQRKFMWNCLPSTGSTESGILCFLKFNVARWLGLCRGERLPVPQCLRHRISN